MTRELAEKAVEAAMSLTNSPERSTFGEFEGAGDDFAGAELGWGGDDGGAGVGSGGVVVVANVDESLFVAEGGEGDLADGAGEAVGEGAGDGAVVSDGEGGHGSRGRAVLVGGGEGAGGAGEGGGSREIQGEGEVWNGPGEGAVDGDVGGGRTQEVAGGVKVEGSRADGGLRHAGDGVGVVRRVGVIGPGGSRGGFTGEAQRGH